MLKLRKKLLFMAVILAFFLALTGCASPVEKQDDKKENPIVESVPAPTLPPPQKVSPADTLRVATRGDVDLNPLWPKHYATASLLRLVHLPLFDIDYDGTVVPVLAGDVYQSSDQKSYRIRLREDALFHSGQPILAEDVVASFYTYRRIRIAEQAPPPDNEEEAVDTPVPDAVIAHVHSAVLTHQYGMFAYIVAMEAEGSAELRINLHEPDPDLLRLLTFPVLPASEVNMRSLNPLTGSGAWQIASSSAEGFSLVRLVGGSPVRRIDALAFSSVLAASRAFDEGLIDLLLMDHDETLRFSDRSRIKKQRFDDDGFISLVFSSQKGRAMELRDTLLYALQEDPGFDLLAAPMSRLAYPVLPTDLRLLGARIPVLTAKAPAHVVEDTRDATGKPEASDRLAFHLLVPDVFIPGRLIDKMDAALARVDRTLIVDRVPMDAWHSELIRGAYDAALMIDASISSLDPVDYLDGLSDLGLWSWREVVDVADQQILLDARRNMTKDNALNDPTALVFSQAMYRVFEKAPVIGLAATGVMVWYSDDVEGTMAGTHRSPYEGAEELLIWRR